MRRVEEGRAHKPVIPCLAIQKAKIILGYIVSSRPAWSTGGSALKMRNLESEERREGGKLQGSLIARLAGAGRSVVGRRRVGEGK